MPEEFFKAWVSDVETANSAPAIDTHWLQQRFGGRLTITKLPNQTISIQPHSKEDEMKLAEILCRQPNFRQRRLPEAKILRQ